MKTAVGAILVGRDRARNRVRQCLSAHWRSIGSLRRVRGHHPVGPVARTPASGWEKGQVENPVGVIRRRLLAPRPRFRSHAELTVWLLDRRVARAEAHPRPAPRDRTIREVPEGGRHSLAPRAGPFDGLHAVPASASRTRLARFDTDRHPVDARAVGRPVEIRAHAERVEFRRDGRVVGERARASGRGKAIHDPPHRIPALAREPGALRNGAPFKEREPPPVLRRVRRGPGRVPDGDRQMVDIPGAAPTDGPDAVEDACAEARGEGVHSAAVILNVLARRREPPPPPTTATPEALRLTREPVV